MKFNKSIIILFLVLANYTFGQDVETKNEEILKKTEYSTHFKAAYLGSIVYPGFKIGVERPFREITKIKRNGKILDKDRLWSLSAGFYHHPTFHSNAFIIAECIRRRTNAKGFFLESSPGIGISRTFLGGTTYIVADNGDITISRGAGHTYGLVSFGCAIGKDFSVNKNKPFAIYLKPSLVVMLPYNKLVYLRPTIELGLILKPKEHLQKLVNGIFKTKNS